MNKYILIVFVVVACLTSCGDDTLPEDYIIIGEKVLAVKIDPPEVAPGDPIEMSLLIGGAAMDQNSTIQVSWLSTELGVMSELPYNQALQLASIPDIIPDGKSSIDIPVYCSVTIDGKTLAAEKYVRITNTPVGKNPVISGVDAHWQSDAGVESTTIAYGDTFNPGVTVENIAFTSLTDSLPNNGNKKLVYKWYVTKEISSDREIEVSDKTANIEALLGTGAKAAEFMESVVYSTGGSGAFNVYLVVRDNALNPSESEQERLGTDFFHFIVNVD